MDAVTVAIISGCFTAGGFAITFVVSIIKGTKAIDAAIEKAVDRLEVTINNKFASERELGEQKLLESSNEVDQCIDKQILIDQELNGKKGINSTLVRLETLAEYLEKRLTKVEDKG